jgi:hypothetical protein
VCRRRWRIKLVDQVAAMIEHRALARGVAAGVGELAAALGQGQEQRAERTIRRADLCGCSPIRAEERDIFNSSWLPGAGRA